MMMSLPYCSSLKTQATVLLLCGLLGCSFTIPAHAKEYTRNDVGSLQTVKTNGPKDTLVDLALREQVGYTQLLAANPGVDPWLPGERDIILPTWHLLPDAKHEGLVLNAGELLLYYFPKDGSAPKTFAIGIGREGLSTPQGTTTITTKRAAPQWRPTPRMRQENPLLPAVVEAGPENPLGSYALYLGWPSYLIHGTNHEKAIGRRASSGCIRTYKEDTEWLFKNITPGTKLTSVNQPVKMAWIDGEFYIEAEPNDLQLDEIEYKNRQVTVDIPDGIIAKIRKRAGDQANRVDWEKVRNVLVTRSGMPVQVTGTAKIVASTEQVKADKKATKDPIDVIAEKEETSKKPINHWDNLNN